MFVDRAVIAGVYQGFIAGILPYQGSYDISRVRVCVCVHTALIYQGSYDISRVRVCVCTHSTDISRVI